MGVIGNILVKLEAESADFEKKTKKAGDSLDQLKEKSGGMSDLFKGFAEGLGIGSAVEGLDLAKEAFEKIIEVGVEAIKTVGEWVAETTKMVTASTRLAQSLNLPTEALMAFQAAASAKGIDTELFNTSLDHLQKNLGMAAEKGGPAAEALDKMGLSARQLTGQTFDKTFEQIAEGISRIQNPTEQAVAAFELFGKSGQKLLPILQGGAAGLEAAKEHAKELGVSISDLDASKITHLGEQGKELQEHFEGMKNQLTIALTPALIKLGDEILAILPDAETMRIGFTEAIHDIGKAVAYLIDTWQAAFAIFDKFQQIAFAQPADETIANLPWASDKVDEWFDNAQKKADELAKHTKAAKPFDPMAENAIDNASKIDQIFNSLMKSVATLGMNEGQKKLFDLQQLGASKEDITAAQQLISQLKEGDINKVFAEIHKSIDTFGMKEGDKKLFDLKAMGAGPADIAQFQVLVDKFNDLTAAAEKAKVVKTATADLAKLKGEIAEFGKTDADKKLFDLEQLHLPPALLKQLEDATKQLDTLKAHAEEMKEGLNIFKENETPLEKYLSMMEKLNKYLADGAINQETYARAALKAHEGLDGGDLNKAAPTLTRRFDLHIPGPKAGQQHTTGLAGLLQKADQQLKSAKQTEYYEQQLYNFARNSQDTSTVVIDI